METRSDWRGRLHPAGQPCRESRRRIIKLIADVGEKFPKQDGTDWTEDEIAKFPKGTVMSAFIKGDQTFYAPFDERTKTATWDNQVHQINEAGNITPENATPLGEARVPTEHQVPGMNPGEKLTLTTTPLTPTHAAPTVTNQAALPRRRSPKSHGASSRERKRPNVMALRLRIL